MKERGESMPANATVPISMVHVAMKFHQHMKVCYTLLYQVVFLAFHSFGHLTLDHWEADKSLILSLSHFHMFEHTVSNNNK